MKTRLATLLLCALCAQVRCQDAKPAAAELTALLFTEEGSKPAWIMEASNKAIRYRETEAAVDSQIANLADIQHIYIYEPREFTAAMRLFRARKYQEAKDAFKAVKERYKPMARLKDNPSVLAAFYEMECLRKLGDLKGLETALQNFDKRELTNENHQRQVELYVMWRLLQEQNWKSIDNIANERAKTRMPGDQRAQIAYCQGMALEGLGRPGEAMMAYQSALVVDAGASEEITRLASLRILNMLAEDAEVKRAIRDWGGKDEKRNTPGYNKLLEASALAVMFEKMLGGGSPLPDRLKDLTKYRPTEEKKTSAP